MWKYYFIKGGNRIKKLTAFYFFLSGRFFKNWAMAFIFTSREKIKPLFYKTLFH